MIVAIDGLAASGKGTLARKLAERFDFAHLDTGVLYRAVAALLVEAGADPADAEAEPIAAAIAARLTVTDLARTDLRDARTGRAASYVAAHGSVRQALLDYQREFALQPPGGKGGAILDGRDIGSKVCPGADVKIFVVARPAVRAARRARELEERGVQQNLDELEVELLARDERDRTRAESPMMRTPDAHLLDTSDLSINASVDAAAAIILRHVQSDGAKR